MGVVKGSRVDDAERCHLRGPRALRHRPQPVRASGHELPGLSPAAVVDRRRAGGASSTPPCERSGTRAVTLSAHPSQARPSTSATTRAWAPRRRSTGSTTAWPSRTCTRRTHTSTAFLFDPPWVERRGTRRAAPQRAGQGGRLWTRSPTTRLYRWPLTRHSTRRTATSNFHPCATRVSSTPRVRSATSSRAR